MVAEPAQPVVGLGDEVLGALDGGLLVVGDEPAEQLGEAMPFRRGERGGELGVAVGDGLAHALQGGTALVGH